MTVKNLRFVLLVPSCLLLVPLVMTRVDPQNWKWEAGSFVVAWGAMVSVGLAYKFIAQHATTMAYRVATALGLFAGFMLLWVNGAVGLIGSEDNPANLMYAGVLVVGALGAAIARFAPFGMARALFLTAFAQFLVPIIALIAWPADFEPGVLRVFAANFGFVLLFAISAILYRHASNQTELEPRFPVTV